MATPSFTELVARSQIRPVFRRFWSKVDFSAGPDACWPWTASYAVFGYGQFMFRHNHISNTHRFAYVSVYGAIPDGLIVRHKCDNPPCCNPAHLEPGTKMDNMTDKMTRGRYRKGRVYRGSTNARAKLNEETVAAILERLTRGESDASLAREYGIDKKGVRLIRLGLVWKHVPRPNA